MSNAESGEGKSQESLPDLYKLLGLSPLEADVNKIQRALLALQKKADAAQQSDAALTQRIVRVVALGKKNLLDAQRKIAYDRAWTKAFGSSSREDASVAMAVPAAQEKSAGQPVAKPASKSAERPVVATPVAGTVTQAVADRTDQTTGDLEWDLNELESYLPAEDPRAPFDLGGFLRYSATLPETNAYGDYEKLQSFLGGAATATIEAPRSVAATELMGQFARVAELDSEDLSEPEPFIAPKSEFVAAPRIPPLPPGGIAKHLRRKRNRAMLLNVGAIVALLAVVLGGGFYFLSNLSKPNSDKTELAQANPEKEKSDVKGEQAKPAEPAEEIAPAKGSGLPRVGGLDGEAVAKPNLMDGFMPENSQPPNTPAMPSPAAMPANEPMPPATMNNAPATPPATTPPATDPAMMKPEMTPAPGPTPAPSTEPAPEPTPEPTPPPADPELSAAEKSAWSKAMKETIKTLGAQNFKLAKEQLVASEQLAKTQLQKEQHKRLSTVATLTEEFHQFLVDAVTGLGAAETFKVGRSLEASFIEGNETSISVKIRGQIQTFAFTELQIGLAMGLVDLKMDTEHPNSLARKAAFALVHPKTNGLALKAAREQMVAAAAAGAVAADMPNVFDDDYSLK